MCSPACLLCTPRKDHLDRARHACRMRDGERPAGGRYDCADRWPSPARGGERAPDWTGYLAGGLDALEQMIDNDGGPDALDPRN